MGSKENKKNIIVLGFALFAMFFGAGNLIFPPYLGLTTGEKWFSGFLCFMVVDAGRAVLALLAVFRSGNKPSDLFNKLGKPSAMLLTAIITLCIGPLVSIPRTAATTFELAVQPLLPDCSSWVSAAVFFLVVGLLCIHPTKIVDIVGKILSPLMLVALAIMIFKGIFSPIKIVDIGVTTQTALKDGLAAGYQTMDMMGAVLFSTVVLTDITAKGYSRGHRLQAVGLSGCVAALGLFAVYGGLTFLGASAAGTISPDLGQSGVLLALINSLLGENGIFLLGIIVAAACLTTAIGLVSASAESFCALSGGKLSYRPLVIVICVISFVISNAGLSAIIALAAPVLELIYPVLVSVVILSFLPSPLCGKEICRGAALASFFTAVYEMADRLSGIGLGSEFLPFASVGLGWLLPAAFGAVLGGIWSRRVKQKRKQSCRAAC